MQYIQMCLQTLYCSVLILLGAVVFSASSLPAQSLEHPEGQARIDMLTARFVQLNALVKKCNQQLTPVTAKLLENLVADDRKAAAEVFSQLSELTPILLVREHYLQSVLLTFDSLQQMERTVDNPGESFTQLKKISLDNHELQIQQGKLLLQIIVESHDTYLRKIMKVKKDIILIDQTDTFNKVLELSKQLDESAEKLTKYVNEVVKGQ